MNIDPALEATMEFACHQLDYPSLHLRAMKWLIWITLEVGMNPDGVVTMAWS